MVPLLLRASNNSFHSDAVCFWPECCLFLLDGTLPCMIMLQLLLILKFTLTSFLYQNAFLAIPLLLRASNDSFCSDAICFLAQMLFMLDGILPCIIMLELLLILKFILKSFLYQNDFLAVPLLLRSSDNLFRSDAVWVFCPHVVHA